MHPVLLRCMSQACFSNMLDAQDLDSLSRRLVTFLRYHSDYYHSSAIPGGGWVHEQDITDHVWGYRVGDAASLVHWSLEAQRVLSGDVEHMGLGSVR
jgi:hypothetical protein